MPRAAASPVPRLISDEELRAHRGVSLRLDAKSKSLSVLYRDPMDGNRSKERTVHDLTREGVRSAVRAAHRIVVGSTQTKGVADPRTPMAVVAARWYEEHLLNPREHKAETAESYRPVMNRYFLTVWGGKAINCVSRRDIELHFDHLKKVGIRTRNNKGVAAPVSPDMERKAANVLRNFFSWAVAAGYIIENPTCDLRCQGQEVVRHADDYMTMEEVLVLLESLELLERCPVPRVGVKDATYYRMHILMLARTGLRISELCALRWAHVTWHNDGTAMVSIKEQRYRGEVTAPKGSARRIAHGHKPASQRTIPLPQDLAEELRAHKERQIRMGAMGDEDLVFTTKMGKQLRASNFNDDVFRRVVDVAMATGRVVLKGDNPKRVTPHTLRHTAITSWAREEIRVEIIMDMAGHEDFKTTLRYIGRGLEDKQREMLKVSKAYAEAVEKHVTIAN